MACFEQARWRRGLWLAAIVLSVCLLAGLAAAAPAELLAPHTPVEGRVPAVEILEDATGALSFPEVIASDGFHAPARSMNVGYSRSIYWVRFAIRNEGGSEARWLLELYRTCNVTLHALSRAGPSVRSASMTRPFSEREVQHANVVLPLVVAAGETATYYLRVHSDDTLDLTPKLWSERAFSEKWARENLAAGVYYGLIIALILYNLFIFLATRQTGYGAYVVFQLGSLGTQAGWERYTFQWLWPESPTWAAPIEFVFGGVMVLGASLFARAFLDLPTLAPGLDRIAKALAAGGVGLAVLGAITVHTYAQQAGLAFVGGACAVLVGSGVVALSRRSPYARYYLFGWAPLLLGSGLDMLISVGVLPGELPTVWFRVGSAAEALVLAFGLAHRINVIQRDRDRAAAELAESRRAYAETLERRVDERTKDLASALERLEATQKELAQKERLASLGRLVSAVAHEINNPLNFSVGGASKLGTELEAVARAVSALHEVAGEPARMRTDKALATARRALGLVQAGNDRIAAIVQNLQAYVRLGRVEPEPADLRAEIERTLDLAHDVLERSAVRVVRRIEALAPYPCRAGELAQVFTNLVVNACQAMPNGGELTVTCATAGGLVRIVFSDTGHGVAPEHRDAIFEPFFTTRAPGEGTGLGLSISHEIVRNHGGELRLLPSHVGAAFEIRLPIS